MRTHTAKKNTMNQPAVKAKAPMASAPARKGVKGLGLYATGNKKSSKMGKSGMFGSVKAKKSMHSGR